MTPNPPLIPMKIRRLPASVAALALVVLALPVPAADAARFGLETTRPLLVAAASGPQAPGSLFTLSPPGVLVETVKVSEDGKALILRLFGGSGAAETAVIKWGTLQPPAVWLTDLTEKPLTPAPPAIAVPAYGIVHLRADLP